MANATPPAMQMNVTTELRRLQKVVDDLEGMLRQHQQILRQKAMSLPQGFLPEIQKLRTDMENIAKSLDEAQTEVIRLRSLSDTAELINSTLDLDDVLAQPGRRRVYRQPNYRRRRSQQRQPRRDDQRGAGRAFQLTGERRQLRLTQYFVRPADRQGAGHGCDLCG